MAQKVDRVALDGGTRLRAWASGAPESWRYREVGIGQSGGRWFAQRTGRQWSGVWLCADEREACDLADSWMRGEGWRTAPAQYGADGQPTEAGWVKRGGTWWRE